MKKNDWILTGGILIAALAAFFLWNMGKGKGDQVRVTVAGKETAVYPLSREGSYEIGDGNRMEIKDNGVHMIWADCPDQLCVRQGTIQESGRTIVCLPNQVVLEIISEEKPVLDGVAG